MEKNYDFSGWATRNDIECADGRVIRKNAFADQDGKTVPLVWNHDHNDPTNVLGHAILENRDEGVYAYGYFNDSERGQYAKDIVKHGDVKCLSIWANKLKEQKGNVMHGVIREVSLVLSGANPGAYIENIFAHGDDGEDGAYIFHDLEYDSNGQEISDLEINEIQHSIKENVEGEKMAKEKTVKDVIDSMTEEQRNVMYALIGEALESVQNSNQDGKEENEDMKHNVFENGDNAAVLSHSDMEDILKDAKRIGSLRESFIEHMGEDAVLAHDGTTVADPYGITNIDYLFPDARNVTNQPTFIDRNQEWVKVVMGGAKKSPFSRIKSIFADITEDEARAKGYIKGELKKEEVFSLLKRSTTPQTVYKKQKLDRDDVIDITDFDVVAWLKSEMRGKLDEEIARAVLIGDGRLASDDDKISEDHIRPIVSDASLYTIVKEVTESNDNAQTAKDVIKDAVRARKYYKGSGNPTFFTSEALLAEMLLIEDGIGHRIYKTEQELSSALRVKNIVTVPQLDDTLLTNNKIWGIIVNMSDYTIGADKGGAVNMFDDFDIDYNQQKYLIETRCSGALTVPYSAIVLKTTVLPQ